MRNENPSNQAPHRAAAAESAEVQLVRLHELDGDVVVRTSQGGGSEADVEKGVGANCAKQYQAERAREATAPSCLTTDEERAGFTAATLETAEKNTSSTSPPVEQVLPGLAGQLKRSAATAQQALPKLCEKLAAKKGKQHDQNERHVMEQSGAESVASLRRKRTWWRAAEVALWTAETLALFVVFAIFFGLFSGYAPASAILQASGMTLISLAASMGIALAASRALDRFTGGRQVHSLLGLVVVVCAVLFFGALGLLRTSSTQSEFGDDGGSAGEGALRVIVTLAPAIVAAVAVYVRRRIKDLDERIAAVDRMERRHRDEAALVAGPVVESEEEIAKREAEVRRPDELRSAFEAAVHRVRRLKREHELATAERILAAKSAYRQLMQLSAPQREQVVSDAYVLYKKTESSPTSAERAAGRANGNTGKVLTVALLAAGLAGQSACGAPPVPRSMAIICDGTGRMEAQVDVCTRPFLRAAFTAWARDAAGRPGSSFIVVNSAGSYRDVRVAAKIEAPPRPSGPVRGARGAWFNKAIAMLDKVVVPVDTEQNRRVNKSNLLGALAATGRMVALDLPGQTDLLVAGDGWHVGLGLNFEVRVPSAREVVSTLSRARIPWDLSAFKTITICGLHHRGAQPAAVAARDRTLRDLVVAGGAPAPALRTSCQGLFPPAPAARRSAATDDVRTAGTTR